MSTVPIRDLRNNSADVMARVARGESLTVTRDGAPVATVSPLRRRSSATTELIKRRRSLPPVDPADLRRDLDAVLDSSL
ncbi:MAG TPA: type II toxin-antitoxin system prevent-host-death family antitoxin [Phycicoccus sp.]|nr:type II toxin-antitoxin system prevent-host-death family antitoxin [Phycicoccus sp.]HQH07165.1 type II toxin-antitoxin system prevent-host-death family antitoxin [Phycicoccus sp.]HQK30175.1 type II toxin-antitoxin system prevent-host-death family antitoxin [Phycicoccus sp.]HQV92583.1 type II toxin-antitoxin system prevent-host-death family antitoxin [Phycicoccus sp.]HQY97201.1 type II toxin-antitoxin system prevent-host-death family antitoxin [Phycicoccus sp.]